MFINKIQLKNFKRFTDLTVDLSGVQPPPRLVLLIGANGSGKTCVFDAFEWLSLAKSASSSYDPAYYRKIEGQEVASEIEFIGGSLLRRVNDTAELFGSLPSNYFYGRSAFRQVPQLTRTAIGGRANLLESDDDRPRLYIQLDQRFENDVDILAEKIVQEIFIDGRFDAEEIRNRYILPINEALSRIFKTDPATSLVLQALFPPLQNKPVRISFRKGQSEIEYDLLSSGEKEVINILFNLFVRKESFRDTVYFIDELDVHLNTALQYDLLKEVTENWIPDGCQLWTASHSLGFIHYAREAEQAAILDFDLLDFDVPHTITPQLKEATEIYEIAVPAEVLPNLFRDKQLVLCENKNDSLYQLLGLRQKVFYGVKDKNEVYYRVKNNPALSGLIDRDYLTDSEIAKIRRKLPSLFVLHYYAFENYLFHPENIRELLPNFDSEEYRAEIIRQKNGLYDEILIGLKQARSYKVLKDENLEDPDATKTIINALKSDDFEVFYPYFDMKGKFNRQSLAKLNLSDKRLVRTKWFRTVIKRVFEQ
ncbi:MAG: AAA family ATPase [Acidobacteria bacterium]|nr:AAA family ATPase [Acidobacteriota bacterium]